MNPTPHFWRQPTVARKTTADAPVELQAAPAQLPLHADLTALLAQDDTLLATLRDQCRIKGLYIVHNGRETKVTPYVEPGWRVIVEIDKDSAREARDCAITFTG